jgi:hypothetical protein
LSAADVRWEQGRLLRFSASDSSIIAGDVRVHPGAGNREFRHVAPRDFTMAGPDLLAVSATVALGLGLTTNVILLHRLEEPDAPAQALATGDVLCDNLAWGAGALWCFGPDLKRGVAGEDFYMLWRVGMDGSVHGSLPRSTFPRELPAPPWSAGALGTPQVLVSDEAVWLWVPNLRSLLRCDLNTRKTQVFPLPLEVAGRSMVNFALARGRPVGLFPLNGAGEEQLTTLYGFFALDQETRAWTRLPPPGTVERGTLLLAVQKDEAVLWTRRGSHVFRRALRSP